MVAVDSKPCFYCTDERLSVYASGLLCRLSCMGVVAPSETNVPSTDLLGCCRRHTASGDGCPRPNFNWLRTRSATTERPGRILAADMFIREELLGERERGLERPPSYLFCN
jgi:hypothetical protein